MCGRYVAPETAAIESAWHLGPSNGEPFSRRFNVAPAMPVQIIYGDRQFGEPRLGVARWGLVPGWWKQSKPPSHCFNARSEDAATKPVWKHSYRNARCIVPAEGWYEWTGAQRVDQRTGEIKDYRKPYFIARPDRRLVGFAGLMSFWYPNADSMVLTCAIVTKAARGPAASLHDRMPVVLQESNFTKWLDANVRDAGAVMEMITAAETDFEHYAVSTRLNTSNADDERLLERVNIEATEGPRPQSVNQLPLV